MRCLRARRGMMMGWAPRRDSFGAPIVYHAGPDLAAGAQAKTAWHAAAYHPAPAERRTEDDDGLRLIAAGLP